MHRRHHRPTLKTKALLTALVDASYEAPPHCLGRLISLHPTEVSGRIAELDWAGSQINPRTRVVTLNRPLVVGALVDARTDLAPLAKLTEP